MNKNTRKNLGLAIHHPYAEFGLLPFLDDFVSISKLAINGLHEDGRISDSSRIFYLNVLDEVRKGTMKERDRMVSMLRDYYER